MRCLRWPALVVVVISAACSSGGPGIAPGVVVAPGGGSASLALQSDLWGVAGERWTAVSRLPDVSYAGYQRGEQEIPSPAVVASVRDFGAVGDGVALQKSGR